MYPDGTPRPQSTSSSAQGGRDYERGGQTQLHPPPGWISLFAQGAPSNPRTGRMAAVLAPALCWAGLKVTATPSLIPSWLTLGALQALSGGIGLGTSRWAIGRQVKSSHFYLYSTLTFFFTALYICRNQGWAGQFLKGAQGLHRS